VATANIVGSVRSFRAESISSNSPNEASTGWSTEEGVAAVSDGGRDHRKSRKGDWQPPLLN
jgi:hypothetical protein